MNRIIFKTVSIVCSLQDGAAMPCILTCEIQVLQWRLWSDGGTEFRGKTCNAMVCSIDLTLGSPNVVLVSYGGASIHILNL